MKQIIILSLLIAFAGKGMAQNTQSIAGIWWNDKKTSKIEINEENGKFSGTIVYIIPERYVNGEPDKDHKNPDPKLRTRSRLGLQLLSGLKFNASDKKWTDGRIYDPENGKTYDCYAWFENDPNSLYIRGYVVGIKLLGRSTVWIRTTL